MKKKTPDIVKVLVVVSLIIYGPYLLLTVFIGGNMLLDRLSGTSRVLNREDVSTSPDGKIRFVAKKDGSLYLVDNRTNKTLHKNSISTKDYSRVEGKWLDNHQVKVVAAIRYATTVPGRTYTWDSESGDFW